MSSLFAPSYNLFGDTNHMLFFYYYTIMNKTKTKRNLLKINKHNKTKKNSAIYSHQLLIEKMLHLQLQIKFLHWKTPKYHIHMITDKFHTKLSKHIDSFIEISLGQNIPLHAINHYYGKIEELHLKEDTLKHINNLVKIIHSSTKLPRDIQAVLDELLIDINTFKYLFIMA